MSQVNRSSLVTYSALFGSAFQDRQNPTELIEKNEWAKVVARLNHLTRTRSSYPPNRVISEWFSKENEEEAHRIWDRIVAVYGGIPAQTRGLTVVNTWTNLTLFDRILMATLDKPEALTNSEIEAKVFELYLAINDEAATRADEISKDVTEDNYPDISDRFARILIATVFPYHDLNHFNAVELLIAHFIKSYLCLEFLSKSYPDLLETFLAPYGVREWKDYLKGILPIAHLAAFPGDDSGLNYLTLEKSTDKEKSRTFLNHLTLVTEEEYAIKTDFLHARSHPLFRVAQDEYLIIDSVLAVNRVYNSMFFELLRIAEKQKLLKGKFFNIFTYEFLEKHLSYSVLDWIYGQSNYLHLTGSQIFSQFHVDTEPDYYARKGNKVFLYEIKGSMVTGPAKQSFSYQEIENELKEKFFYDTSDGGNKAVKQLAERIRILLTQSSKSVYDATYDPGNIRIFPILLVSEIMMTAPGINHILNEWFRKEIEDDELMQAAKHRIHDLVVIDIDTLILFSDKFASNPGLLKTYILSYNSSCSKQRIEDYKEKPSMKSLAGLEAVIMSTLMPFSSFIRDRIAPKAPKLFEDFAKDLFADNEI